MWGFFVVVFVMFCLLFVLFVVAVVVLFCFGIFWLFIFPLVPRSPLLLSEQLKQFIVLPPFGCLLPFLSECKEGTWGGGPQLANSEKASVPIST